MHKYLILPISLFLFSCSIVDKQAEFARQKVGHFSWVDAHGAVHSHEVKVGPRVAEPALKSAIPSPPSGNSLVGSAPLKNDGKGLSLGDLLANNINVDSKLSLEQFQSFTPENELLDDDEINEDAIYTVVDAAGVPTTYSTGEKKGDGLKRKAKIVPYSNPRISSSPIPLDALRACCNTLDFDAAVDFGVKDNLHLRLKPSSSIFLYGTETSYRLLSLDKIDKLSYIYIRSLLEDDSFFIPSIVTLDQSGKPLSLIEGLVHRIRGESWARYAYIDGYVSVNMIPKDAKYLLFFTSARDLSSKTLVPKSGSKLPSFKLKSLQVKAVDTFADHALSGSILVKHSFKPR